MLMPVAALLAALLIPLTADAAGQHADRIFINGKIWTGDENHPKAEAIAITGDKTLAVGSTQEIRALAANDTAVVDLKGRLLKTTPCCSDRSDPRTRMRSSCLTTQVLCKHSGVIGTCLILLH